MKSFRSQRSMLLAVASCHLLLVSGAESAFCRDEGNPSRPESWARPLEVEGVRNLFKVSEDLYRSAQPTAEGMRNLEEFGVRTIVSVRFFHASKRRVEGTGLTFERIPIKPWHPRKKEVVRFLQIVTDPDQTPALLHCYKGADRTGMLSAIYRIAVQGWTKEAAIKEMKEGGYGFSPAWNNLVRWIEKTDIESLCTQAGLSVRHQLTDTHPICLRTLSGE